MDQTTTPTAQNGKQLQVGFSSGHADASMPMRTTLASVTASLSGPKYPEFGKQQPQPQPSRSRIFEVERKCGSRATGSADGLHSIQSVTASTAKTSHIPPTMNVDSIQAPRACIPTSYSLHTSLKLVSAAHPALNWGTMMIAMIKFPNRSEST